MSHPGHYPICIHDFACVEDHHHALGVCCAPTCWCQQPALVIRAYKSTMNRGPRDWGHLVHDEHPLCAVVGWHGRSECPACLDAAAELRPVKVDHPGRDRTTRAELEAS